MSAGSIGNLLLRTEASIAASLLNKTAFAKTPRAQRYIRHGYRPLYRSPPPPRSLKHAPSPAMSVSYKRTAQALSLPPPPADGSLRVLQVDFASLGLPDLSSRTCLIIDNLLTPEDVAKLYCAATLSGPWVQAKVSVAIGLEILNTEYRNSGRIILDDHVLAGWLFDKIEPHLSDSVRRVNGAEHHGSIGSSYYDEVVSTRKKDDGSEVVIEPVARVTRLNERLRFLRYEPGMYFQPHCDGQYWTPDTRECSYFTLQVYLKGEGDEGVSLSWPACYCILTLSLLQNLPLAARPVSSATSHSIVESPHRKKVSNSSPACMPPS
jgi:hypothetical protein